MRRRGLVLGIELLHHEQFSSGWNSPCYGKGRFSCPRKGHLCAPRLQPRHHEVKMCPGSKFSPFALCCHQTAPAAAQDLIHSGWDAAAPSRSHPQPRASPAEGHPGLLQPLCALPAGDLPLILRFNLPDFIFKPSVLIIPLSAKLKSPLIPGTFLPGKVFAPCNQVTSQATFR